MQPDLSSKPHAWIDLAGLMPAGRSFKSELQQTMRIGRICAWLLGSALLAACSTAPPPDCAAQSDITEYRQRLSQAAAEIPYGQGLFWRVDSTDAPPSYVFGTAHSKSAPGLLTLYCYVFAQLISAGA
jgi:hypothetical protein